MSNENKKILKIIVGIIAVVIALKIVGVLLSLIFGIAFPFLMVGSLALIPLLLIALFIAIPIVIIYFIYKIFIKK